MCLMLLVLSADQSAALREPVSVSRERKLLTMGDDSVTDQFLQRFRPLRRNTVRRHVLAAEIVSAAGQYRIDPDLLFAVVAVESGFEGTAVSSKGARGLGQLMFATAQEVAPSLVRRPSDLYDARRNLAVTAKHLYELLIASRGDLRAALTAYHLGPHDGHPPRRKDTRYVSLICTYYASLKVRRRFGETKLMAERAIDIAEK